MIEAPTAPRKPSEFLVAAAARLPLGRALDVACGEGRNAVFLAQRGHRVIGIDRDFDALAKARSAARAAGVRLHLVQADLERWHPPSGAFDVVVNVRYLQRSLVPAMREAVRPGGMVLFETFLADQLALGHPRNPEFALAHNELLRLFDGFRVLLYEEGRFEMERGPVYLARLLAQRPAQAD